jgi:hypothetical protein
LAKLADVQALKPRLLFWFCQSGAMVAECLRSDDMQVWLRAKGKDHHGVLPMPRKKTSSLRPSVVDIFGPAEHVVLAHWLGQKPPTEAEGLSLQMAVELLSGDAGATLPKDAPVEAAVAFVLLERVEEQLPQWSTMSDEGMRFARPYRDPDLIPLRKVAIVPRRLFTINWATSGPGFDWPEEYRITWVPYYDRWVVTASRDDEEPYGYRDNGIGHFGVDVPVRDGSRQAVMEWWCSIRDAGLQRWEAFRNMGLVDAAEAGAWAEEIWPVEDEDEEEGDNQEDVD